MKKNYTTIRACRICGSRKLLPVLDLGAMPPANAFLRKKDFVREKKFPLRVVFCSRCSLVQLRDTVSPSLLFGMYTYLSGASAPLTEHFARYSNAIKKRYRLKNSDLVVDIGSNDGTLLSQFKRSCRVLGVEPAARVAALARRRGIATMNAFFTPRLAARIVKKNGKAAVICANNVFAHIDDVHEILEGVKVLLADGGVFVSESHWVGNLVGKGGFDQIYHEHLCYFSLHALDTLARLHGMRISDAELMPMHGESLRVHMSVRGTPSPRVKRLLAKEKRAGLTRASAFRSFAKKVSKNSSTIRALLHSLKKKHKRIAGYGAPAKGNTLLNYCRIGPEIVDYITDTTPLKQGTYAPGSHIPVVPPARLKENTPEYILLLSWNYADAILKQEEALRHAGVKFIIPVPKVAVV